MASPLSRVAASNHRTGFDRLPERSGRASAVQQVQCPCDRAGHLCDQPQPDTLLPEHAAAQAVVRQRSVGLAIE